MSPSDDESLGLDAVKGPAKPPPTEPDPSTQLEEASYLREAREMAGRSPSVRIIYASERERTSLVDQCSELRRECRSLQQRLHDLEPRYSSLRRTYLDLKGAAGASTLVMFAGSVVVSVAGGRDWPPSTKNVILGIGAAASICGLA